MKNGSTNSGLIVIDSIIQYQRLMYFQNMKIDFLMKAKGDMSPQNEMLIYENSSL